VIERDRGSVTVELVLIFPVLLGFLFLMVAAGRLSDARSDVVSTAADAARAASLQPTAAVAQAQASAAAQDTASGERLNCRGGPEVDTTFPGGFGPGGIVRVEVHCAVATGDLTFIGLPITVDLHDVAWEPIDANRSF
jgi:hypothetical protein